MYSMSLLLLCSLPVISFGYFSAVILILILLGTRPCGLLLNSVHASTWF